MHRFDGLGPIDREPPLRFLSDHLEVAGTYVAVEVHCFGIEPVQRASSHNATQAYLDWNVNVDTYVGLHAIGGNRRHVSHYLRIESEPIGLVRHCRIGVAVADYDSTAPEGGQDHIRQQLRARSRKEEGHGKWYRSGRLGIQEQLADTLSQRGAAGLTGFYHVEPLLSKRGGKQTRLRRLPAAIRSLECHE